jgi:hypothetical protein
MDQRMADKRNTWKLLASGRAGQPTHSWFDDHAPSKPQRPPQEYKQRPDWQLQQTERAFQIVFRPDGRAPPNLTHKEVQRRIEPVFKENSCKLASTETIRRLRNRHKRTS